MDTSTLYPVFLLRPRIQTTHSLLSPECLEQLFIKVFAAWPRLQASSEQLRGSVGKVPSAGDEALWPFTSHPRTEEVATRGALELGGLLDQPISELLALGVLSSSDVREQQMKAPGVDCLHIHYTHTKLISLAWGWHSSGALASGKEIKEVISWMWWYRASCRKWRLGDPEFKASLNHTASLSH